jgi:ribulose-5-phosphate 4-epimerase/fuculose-1-phosphate aldolase
MNSDIVDDLILANRILANEGILEAFGHVSAFDPDSETVYISGSRSPKLVSKEDIMCVTLDGKIVHNSEIRPYTELVLHRAIYQSREDINAIVHLHSDEIMPFAASNTEIKPVYHLGTPFHQGVPTFTDFDGKHGRLIVTESEAERMAEDLNSCNAQLIENHGANVVGQDLRDVTVITKYFVKNARYQYEAEQLEETSYYTGSTESLEQMATKVRSNDSINRMWDYLVSNLNDTKGSY